MLNKPAIPDYSFEPPTALICLAVFCLGSGGMRTILVIFFTMGLPCVSMADLASTQYVHESVATRVDTSANATQTMAGDYTVSGTFSVPTPPLPSPE